MVALCYRLRLLEQSWPISSNLDLWSRWSKMPRDFQNYSILINYNSENSVIFTGDIKMLLFTLGLTMLAISAAGRLPVEGIFHMSANQSRDCGLLYQFMAQASGKYK